VAGLMALYVQHSKWDDALLMVHAHPECRCAPVRRCPRARCLAGSGRAGVWWAAGGSSCELPLAHRCAGWLAACREAVYLPYAKWLAASDRFEEAREAFRQGGRPDLATATLEQLTANAVAERRCGLPAAGRMILHTALLPTRPC
jgi:hypothetical protein